MSLPGFNPPLASVVLGHLMTRWVDMMRALPEGETSNSLTDELTLAALLLAHENAALVSGTNAVEVNECLEVARSGSWAHLDDIPWLLVQGYVTTGKADALAIRRVESMLGHGNSNIREWFHSVAWMVWADLSVENVRPILLQNLADKLGAVRLSAGLLAVMHPDKTVLDEAADAFVPEEFKFQYQDRIRQIRESEWNSQPFNLWLAENSSRKLIWNVARAFEMDHL